MPETFKSKIVSSSPFTLRINAPGKGDFDKYYDDIEYKEVYRKAGIDKDGEEYGVIEVKAIVRKRDIAEYINSQADTVGVEAYMRALAVQGVGLDDLELHLSDDIQDFTDMPKDKFEGSLYGDHALEIFSKLDPALKGKHTTIAGFLNSLSKDVIDNYIKGRVEAAFPKSDNVEKGE